MANRERHAVGEAGFSLGGNLVQVTKGNKTVGEAAGDVAVDTVKTGATSCGIGAAASAIISTTVAMPVATGLTALGAGGAAAIVAATAPMVAMGTVLGRIYNLFSD